MSSIAHPAPHRDRTHFLLLLYGCSAAPLFWLGQLMLAYWVSAEICYGGDHPTTTSMPGALRAAFVVFDAVAVLAALTGGAVATLCWRATREEKAGGTYHAMHVGEGRARFMALWGIFSSLCFFAAIVFNIVASVTVPICAR